MLSPAQNEIVEAVRQGITSVPGLSKKLGKSVGVINAQLTRIANAGQGHTILSS